MSMQQTQVHHMAAFRPDGTCVLWGANAYTGSTDLPVPGPVSTGDETDLYIVPMDDHMDVWYRLRAEAWALDPAGIAAGAEGHPNRLRHTDGVPHPEHGHITLGGTFTWTHPLHPVTAQFHQQIAGGQHPAHPTPD